MKTSMSRDPLVLTGDRPEKPSKRYSELELLTFFRITLRQLSAGDGDANAACPKQKENCYEYMHPGICCTTR